MTLTQRRGSIAGLAQRIRDARNLNGWSQSDLIAEVNEAGGRLARAELSRYETGRSTPGVQAVLWLSVALGVTTDALIQGPPIGP